MDKSRLAGQRRKRQPCRHSNQAHPYESDISLESELAKFDWEGYLGMMEWILEGPSWLDERLASHLDHVMGVP